MRTPIDDPEKVVPVKEIVVAVVVVVVEVAVEYQISEQLTPKKLYT